MIVMPCECGNVTFGHLVAFFYIAAWHNAKQHEVNAEYGTCPFHQHKDIKFPNLPKLQINLASGHTPMDFPFTSKHNWERLSNPRWDKPVRQQALVGELAASTFTSVKPCELNIYAIDLNLSALP